MSESECPEASTGVVVVHGIGVQEPGDTQSTYGGAIERFWTTFGPAASRYGSFSCSQGHLHLSSSAHDSVAIVGEGYWDDVLSRPPSTQRLLLWLAISAPLMMLYTFTRPPRWAGGLLRRWLALAIWILRLAYSLALVFLVEVMIVIAVLIGLVAYGTRLSRRLTRTIALTIGDAYAFSANEDTSANMIQRIVDRAEELAAKSDRLLVLAHSQGGAITFEAIQHERWPQVPTSVITLGSGHKRLALVRRVTATPLGKVALAAGSAITVLLGFLTLGILSDPNQPDDSYAQGQLMGRLAALALLVGLVVFFLNRTTGRWSGERIRASASDWLDIWATHDLVPDGPVSRSGVPTLQVHNGRSIVRDHTTYHLNAPEVIAPVVHQIDPSRLADDQELVKELQLRRQRRLRPRPGLSFLWLGWVPWLRRRLQKSDARAVIDAEFAGQLD